MADDDAEETVVDGSEASEEEEALSDSEKLAIVQHFLLQAPPGEYGEVLKDASQLVDDGVLSAGMLAGIARAYNTRELSAIPRPFPPRRFFPRTKPPDAGASPWPRTARA
jgi:capping protein alpha